jgi:aspartyl-tRNA(Asn)/glutamyl-tRNA(Gln) amidotransferase subunit A
MKHQIKSNNFNAKKSLNLLNSNKILNSSVTTILNLNSKPNPKSLLNNIPYSLKDMISTKDIQTTGGSKILENYVPTFNATIYDKLIDGGAILISKTNCDELGMGGTGLTSGYGKVVNPFDKNRIVGGSSSGSAVQVALDIVPFSVGTDTADSIRTPASYMGLVGFKPSYGIISRYGVIPYAPSLDTVGVLAKTIADIAIVLQTISGYDEKDGTSQKINNKFYDCLKPKSKIKFTLIKDIDQYLNKEVKDIYLDYVKKISEKYEIIYKTIDLRL